MAADPTRRIERVGAEVTHTLRQQVLRPHQSIAEVGFPGDGDPQTGHFAAIDGTGEVIGIVTVLEQSPAADSPGRGFVATGCSSAATNYDKRLADPHDTAPTWWRLRGMATATDHRHQGVGAALVAAAEAHVAAHGGNAVWCHARMPAMPFYEKLGFTVTGDPWEEPNIGPHVFMWRTITVPTPP